MNRTLTNMINDHNPENYRWALNWAQDADHRVSTQRDSISRDTDSDVCMYFWSSQLSVGGGVPRMILSIFSCPGQQPIINSQTQ